MFSPIVCFLQHIVPAWAERGRLAQWEIGQKILLSHYLSTIQLWFKIHFNLIPQCFPIEISLLKIMLLIRLGFESLWISLLRSIEKSSNSQHIVFTKSLLFTILILISLNNLRWNSTWHDVLNSISKFSIKWTKWM